MYIALSQPVVPEYKATVKLTPVEPDMKIINTYSKPMNGKAWFWATLIWVAFLLSLKFIYA